jgi:hypothetical protein
MNDFWLKITKNNGIKCKNKLQKISTCLAVYVVSDFKIAIFGHDGVASKFPKKLVGQIFHEKSSPKKLIAQTFHE